MTCTIISSGEELLLQNKNENEPPCTEIKSKLCDKIWELYQSGYTSFYLNCEYGIPLWSAEIICALKMYNDIELHIVTPYENQSVGWFEEHRDRYYNVHSLSDDVHMIGTQYYDYCYNDADKYMIDQSDLLLVCGESYKNLHSVKYAEAHGIRCVCLSFPFSLWADVIL